MPGSLVPICRLHRGNWFDGYVSIFTPPTQNQFQLCSLQIGDEELGLQTPNQFHFDICKLVIKNLGSKPMAISKHPVGE